MFWNLPCQGIAREAQLQCLDMEDSRMIPVEHGSPSRPPTPGSEWLEIAPQKQLVLMPLLGASPLPLILVSTGPCGGGGPANTFSIGPCSSWGWPCWGEQWHGKPPAFTPCLGAFQGHLVWSAAVRSRIFHCWHFGLMGPCCALMLPLMRLTPFENRDISWSENVPLQRYRGEAETQSTHASFMLTCAPLHSIIAYMIICNQLNLQQTLSGGRQIELFPLRKVTVKLIKNSSRRGREWKRFGEKEVFRHWLSAPISL